VDFSAGPTGGEPVLERPAQAVEAEQDAGDAQDLSHAQGRVRRDALVLLEELDEETTREVDREERGNQKAARAAFTARLLVDEVQAAEHDEAEDDLVDLARMTQRGVLTVEAGEAKAPGAVGQLADDLGVHE